MNNEYSVVDEMDTLDFVTEVVDKIYAGVELSPHEDKWFDFFMMDYNYNAYATDYLHKLSKNDRELFPLDTRPIDKDVVITNRVISRERDI